MDGFGSARLRQNDRLIKATFCLKKPAGIPKPRFAQSRREIIPQESIVERGRVKRLPPPGKLASDVKMENISAIIKPVPNLKDNSPTP
ncbi:MAG TPA: hypothetical protein VKD24_03380, partial [Candidatus Angelobacter sp.]|nr:hypothetical protein [Candidatus Angelobacter sp.]